MVLAIFCDEPATADGTRHVADKVLQAKGRELFIHFPSGMAQSERVVPVAKSGTERNMNTVEKLAAMAAEID